MNIILVNETDKGHLDGVIEQMKTMGSPKIHAVWDEAFGAWVALHGSHRIAAAKDLGLKIEIHEVEYSDNTLGSVIGDEAHDIGDWPIDYFVDRAYERPMITID